MIKRSPLSAAISLAVGAISISFATIAYSQQPQEATEKEKKEAIEEITVTGSRIARNNLNASTPINIVDSEAIEITGAVNISEVLRSLPASGLATFTSTNSNFDVNNSGVNTVELRNLTEDRTLVLVNGRRFVAGVPGTQNVDFNSIPTEFIERIEVVTGGASAVYGSDALAGVVNVILKDNYEGFQISGQSGITEEGDDETHRITMTGGFSFADNRGNAMMSVTYDKENGVYARDRNNLEQDAINEVFFTGNPDDYDRAVTPFFSSYSEKGRIIIPNREVSSGSPDLVLDDNGAVRPYNSAVDGFNRQAFRALSVPTERTLFSGVVNYNLTDNASWFMEANYASSETHSALEPFPFASDAVYGDNAADCFDTDGDEIVDDCAYGISAQNPFVPADMLQAARDANPGVADEDLVLGFVRRTTELDPRGADNLRQTFRIVTGFEGSFLEDFDYKASLNYGRTTQEQKSSGQINVLNMRAALDAVIDPETGEIVCRDEIARLQGCVPVNIFGTGSITAGLDENERSNLLRYLQANSSRSATVEQTVAEAFVSGPLFTLPAGTAEFSVGVEYRDEQSEAIADGLSQQGLNAGNISPPTIGSFDVTEVFGEIILPLVADKPFVNSLELDLAARYSDYSTVGKTSAYAVSLRYSPIEDLLLRSQWSEAVRAPNITELFQGLSETFEGGDDPCEGVTVDDSGNPAFLNQVRNVDDPAAALASGVNPETVNSAIAQACMTDSAVAARVNQTGGLVLSQTEIQGVGGFNGGAAAGGADLFEETANTITFGMVWTPSFSEWAEPLSVTIDYFDIEIEDAIDIIERQDSLDNCYGSGTFDAGNNFCSNIVRYTSGPLIGALRELNAFTQNLAQIETSGLDIQASYGFDMGNYGTLDTKLTYTHLLKYDTIPFEGADAIDQKGEIGYADDKAILGFIYNKGPALVSLSTEWIGSSSLSNDPTNPFYGAEISDTFFHNLQGRYSLTDSTEILFGVDNLTDEFVRIEQGGPEVPTGWNTVPHVYDALGRRYYAGFKTQF